MEKTITIIEDERETLNALTELFEDHGYKVKGFETAMAYFGQKESASKGMFLIDWNLPGIPGIEVARAIRMNDGITPVFLMSANNRYDQVIEGLTTGADHYVKKPFDAFELVARINCAYSKMKLLETNLMNRGIKLLPEASAVIKEGEVVSLTSREFTILEKLHGKNGIVSRQELLDSLGRDATITARNIDVHIHSLRKKVSKVSLSIETVRGFGYRLNT